MASRSAFGPVQMCSPIKEISTCWLHDEHLTVGKNMDSRIVAVAANSGWCSWEALRALSFYSSIGKQVGWVRAVERKWRWARRREEKGKGLFRPQGSALLRCPWGWLVWEDGKLGDCE